MARPNRRFWRILLSAVVAAAITLTLTSSARAQTVTRLGADGVDRADPSPTAPTALVTRGLVDFGARLDQLTADRSKNWVASPLSIAYAFSMARAGAGGETAAEIDRVFGFPATGRDEAFNAVSRQVVPADPRATVLIGNALFTQAGFPVGKPFLSTLAAQYGAGVYTVDFGSPSAAKTMNDWVRAQTADRIRKVFDQVDPDTRLVLANAIYLKADWQQPFDYTDRADFRPADGATRQVPTMRVAADLRYARGAGWQAVELPYAHSDLAMWIMVPDSDGSPDRLLTADSMAAVGAALRPGYIELALPKWDFSTEIDLADPLTRMGVRQAFTGAADFSGIQPGLYINQAIHRADITVDERGTRAAAVTAIGMAVSARVPPATVVKADHPFAFAIVHRPTGVPLFVGHVANPA
jgi:serine protease inhibitor